MECDRKDNLVYMWHVFVLIYAILSLVSVIVVGVLFVFFTDIFVQIKFPSWFKFVVIIGILLAVIVVGDNEADDNNKIDD